MGIKARGEKRRYLYGDTYIDYTREQYKKGIYHEDLERLEKEYPNRVATLDADESLDWYTIVIEGERWIKTNEH